MILQNKSIHLVLDSMYLKVNNHNILDCYILVTLTGYKQLPATRENLKFEAYNLLTEKLHPDGDSIAILSGINLSGDYPLENTPLLRLELTLIKKSPDAKFLDINGIISSFVSAGTGTGVSAVAVKQLLKLQQPEDNDTFAIYTHDFDMPTSPDRFKQYEQDKKSMLLKHGQRIGIILNQPMNVPILKPSLFNDIFSWFGQTVKNITGSNNFSKKYSVVQGAIIVYFNTMDNSSFPEYLNALFDETVSLITRNKITPAQKNLDIMASIAEQSRRVGDAKSTLKPAQLRTLEWMNIMCQTYLDFMANSSTIPSNPDSTTRATFLSAPENKAKVLELRTSISGFFEDSRRQNTIILCCQCVDEHGKPVSKAFVARPIFLSGDVINGVVAWQIAMQTFLCEWANVK